ncbi:MAG TPA: WYL domain-containing protein, partial [Thermaerobacter sp.]
RIWHPSQESRDEPDGSLVLSFRVLGTDEIMRWLLQFGASAQVLAPPSLQEAIAAEAEAMLAQYRGVHADRPEPQAEAHGGRSLGSGR